MPGPGIEPPTSGMPSGRANHYTKNKNLPKHFRMLNVLYDCRRDCVRYVASVDIGVYLFQQATISDVVKRWVGTQKKQKYV